MNNLNRWVSFPDAVIRPNRSIMLPFQLPTCTFHDCPHIPLDLRNRTRHLHAENVSELSKCLGSPFVLLVVPHYQLHELSGVDVGIARRFDVLDDFHGDVSWQAARGLNQSREGADKLFTGRDYR